MSLISIGTGLATHERNNFVDLIVIYSAIVKPAHDETITVNPGESDKDLSSYTVKGYAYSGGGRRVTRVEVSLDDGDTWVLANM